MIVMYAKMELVREWPGCLRKSKSSQETAGPFSLSCIFPKSKLLDLTNDNRVAMLLGCFG